MIDISSAELQDDQVTVRYQRGKIKDQYTHTLLTHFKLVLQICPLSL